MPETTYSAQIETVHEGGKPVGFRGVCVAYHGITETGRWTGAMTFTDASSAWKEAQELRMKMMRPR